MDGMKQKHRGKEVCLREEDKGVQRVKYGLPESGDTTLNYSKESGLLCDASPRRTSPLARETLDWRTGF